MAPKVPKKRASRPQRRPDVDIGALNAFLEAYLQHIQSYDPDLIFGVKPGEPLFHYTDLAGLHGIVKNRDLWLTHSRYSNDDEELVHGERAAREVIEQERAAAKKPYPSQVGCRIARPGRTGRRSRRPSACSMSGSCPASGGRPSAAPRGRPSP